MHNALSPTKKKSSKTKPLRPRMFSPANAMPLVTLQVACFVNFVQGDFTNFSEVADEPFQYYVPLYEW